MATDTPTLVELARLEPRSLGEARRLYTEYLADATDPPWQELLLPEPGVSVGVVLDGRVIGIAYGGPSRRKAGVIILRGIAVDEARARRGYGSRLLGGFEERARDAGFGVVSLGSAGGYVDRFYEKNGYRCVGYLVHAPSDMAGLDTLRQRYAERIEAAESDSRFAVDASAFTQESRRRFLDDFRGATVNPILDKTIDAVGS